MGVNQQRAEERADQGRGFRNFLERGQAPGRREGGLASKEKGMIVSTLQGYTRSLQCGGHSLQVWKAWTSVATM